jgi:iron complex outermembrane receptor protein
MIESRAQKIALNSMMCFLLIGVSSQALAQQTPSPTPAPSNDASPSGLTDIVVTARKTSENLQKAPAAITSVSGQQLAVSGITSALDLEKALPSTNLREEGEVTQVFVRGVGTTTDLPNFSTASAYIFNGIIIPSYGTSGMLFDLDSVQSIAGPQGTLYGGSAAGGAINVNSAHPQNDFSGRGLLEVGDYGMIHGSVGQNAAVSNSLSLRGAVDYERHGAYLNNGIDAENRISGRVSARFTPSSDLDVLLFAAGTKSTGKPNAATVVNPLSSDPWKLPAPEGPVTDPLDARFTNLDDKTYVVGANVKLKVGEGTLTYIPGFVRVADDYNELGPQAKILGLHDREKQISQELRWEQRFGALKLSAGGLYLHKTTDFTFGIAFPTFSTIAPNPPIVPPYYTPTFNFNTTHQVNESEAGYGQAVYSVTDSLRLTAGARFTKDRIAATGTDTPGNFALHRSENTIDWKAGVDYDLTSRILVYANAQSGYIPFGYNPEVSGVGTPTAPVQAGLIPTSRLKAYSGGFKSRFLENRLEINDEVFYYKYANYQAINFDANTARSIVLNAKKATIYGNELSIRASLTRDTKLDFNYVYLHAQFDEFQGTFQDGTNYNYTGNALIDAPRNNIIVGLQQTLHLKPGDLVGRVSTHYDSGFFGDYTNVPGSHNRSFTKTDVTLTYSPSGAPWSVQAFVRNIENSAVFGTLNATSPDSGSGSIEPPRTFGVQVAAHW